MGNEALSEVNTSKLCGGAVVRWCLKAVSSKDVSQAKNVEQKSGLHEGIPYRWNIRVVVVQGTTISTNLTMSQNGPILLKYSLTG